MHDNLHRVVYNISLSSSPVRKDKRMKRPVPRWVSVLGDVVGIAVLVHVVSRILWHAYLMHEAKACDCGRTVSLWSYPTHIVDLLGLHAATLVAMFVTYVVLGFVGVSAYYGFWTVVHWFQRARYNREKKEASTPTDS